MTILDDKFLRKLRQLGIQVQMYFRYVDDTVIGLKGIHYGWYYCTTRKKMIFDQSRTQTLSEDQHTFQQLQAVANSLDKDIQMTIDTPSSNGEGRLPVLDLELWIEQDQIKHTFYQKPMSSPYQIHFRSALARKSKRETLLQEGIRRLRNMGPDVSDLEKQTVMSKYMNSLRISGYDKNYRYILLKGILNLEVRQEG